MVGWGGAVGGGVGGGGVKGRGGEVEGTWGGAGGVCDGAGGRGWKWLAGDKGWGRVEVGVGVERHP